MKKMLKAAVIAVAVSTLLPFGAANASGVVGGHPPIIISLPPVISPRPVPPPNTFIPPVISPRPVPPPTTFIPPGSTVHIPFGRQ